jgi:hypothetical protein
MFNTIIFYLWTVWLYHQPSGCVMPSVNLVGSVRVFPPLSEALHASFWQDTVPITRWVTTPVRPSTESLPQSPWTYTSFGAGLFRIQLVKPTSVRANFKCSSLKSLDKWKQYRIHRCWCLASVAYIQNVCVPGHHLATQLRAYMYLGYPEWHLSLPKSTPPDTNQTQ